MENKSLINLNLSEVADGALQEKFEREFKKVVENIEDYNTDADKKRKITLTLTIVASDASRDMVIINAEAKSTLAPDMPVGTKVLVGLNDDKQPVASELKSGTKGQTYMADDGKLKTDTGEDVDDVEAQKNPKVIDLQKGKEA